MFSKLHVMLQVSSRDLGKLEREKSASGTCMTFSDIQSLWSSIMLLCLDRLYMYIVLSSSLSSA